MLKLFVCSDIHSFYTPLKKALDEKRFDPNNENHWLISCGDVFDRGHESVEVLKFLMSLERKVLVKGNHDILLEELCNRRFPFVDETILKEKKLLQEMIDTCPADRYVKKSIYELQMQILNEYAPKLIVDRSTIKRLIFQLCGGIELTKNNKGLVMKTLSSNLKGKADMKIVSDVVSGLLL